MTPAELLDHATDPDTDEIARPLYVAAAIRLALGRPFVLVGGAAVNFHTRSYFPTDVDLVGSTPSPAEGLRLAELGFVKDGRHFVLPARHGGSPIPVEFPGNALSPFMTGSVDLVEIVPGLTAQVVALDDLMMDRAVQATDGTPETLGEAVRLAVAAYARIDWDGLAHRALDASGAMDEAAALALPRTLARIRREAIRRIREARTNGESTPA